jgi:LPXTG-site transpeptidase (sortase) family protein
MSFTFLAISLLGILILGFFYFLKKRGRVFPRRTFLAVLITSTCFLVFGVGSNIISKMFFTETIFGNIPVPTIQITPPVVSIPMPTSITQITPPNLFEINSEGIYTKLSGNISIPKIGVNAPIVFVGDIKWVNYDHKYGVVHYPDTALPGSVGAGLYSGHSSAPPNIRSQYNYVFSKLENLGPNDDVIINFQGNTYTYKIFRKEIVAPRDFKLREYQGKETITLLSCWPVGTAAKRIIVEAERVE